MKPEQMTAALETAAGQLGVRVRYEALSATGGVGGLCRVREEWCVIIDKKSTASERASILVEALSGMDTDAVALPPQVRAVLQLRRGADKHPVALG